MKSISLMVMDLKIFNGLNHTFYLLPSIYRDVQFLLYLLYRCKEQRLKTEGFSHLHPMVPLLEPKCQFCCLTNKIILNIICHGILFQTIILLIFCYIISFLFISSSLYYPNRFQYLLLLTKFILSG